MSGGVSNFDRPTALLSVLVELAQSGEHTTTLFCQAFVYTIKRSVTCRWESGRSYSQVVGVVVDTVAKLVLDQMGCQSVMSGEDAVAASPRALRLLFVLGNRECTRRLSFLHENMSKESLLIRTLEARDPLSQNRSSSRQATFP